MTLVLEHLWQSTLVAAGIAALAWALRRSTAHTRHLLWVVASAKFLVPFAPLLAAGAFLARWLPSSDVPVVSTTLRWLTTPAALWTTSLATATRPPSRVMIVTLIAVWAVGAAVVVFARWRSWRALARVTATATHLESGREAASLRAALGSSGVTAALPLLSSSERITPGVAGILRPRLLWPATLSARLSDDELHAVLAHEAMHVRRRDALAAAPQILAETLFWFHPIVWWIGRRLVIERERACDEAVLALGADRRTYAEALLKVCGFGLQPATVWVAHAGNDSLARRIEVIMTWRPVPRSTLSRFLLAAVPLAVVVVPLTAGALRAGSGGPFTIAGQHTCDVTGVFHMQPPDVPGSLTFSGTPGPWHVNDSNSLAATGGSPAPGTLHTKILWIRQPGVPLTVEAFRLDDTAVTATVHLSDRPADGIQPSSLDYATSGCWQIVGRAGTEALTFTIDVPPVSSVGSDAHTAGEPPVRDLPQTTPDGITLPQVVHEVKPGYTPEAMAQRIQGGVLLKAVVLEDGTVGEVRIERSLDPVYGLDEAAVRAMKEWRFKPGTKDGHAVRVAVDVEMTFRLK